MAKKQIASKARLTAAERERQATALRLGGATYRAIGEALGITTQGAYKAVMRSLKKTREKTAENAEELREMEKQRLESLVLAATPQAKKGHLGAIETVRRLSESLRKLQGIDAPAKREITGGSGKPLFPAQEIMAAVRAAVRALVPGGGVIGGDATEDEER